MKTKKVILAIGVLIAIIFIGWTMRSPKQQTKEQAQTKIEQKPIKIGIIVYPAFGMFYATEEKGFFKEEGIEVEIVQIPDENYLISALASDEVQMLISTPDFTTMVANAGVEVKQLFFTDIGYGSDGLVVKNDINDIADLKGKEVHLSMGMPSHFLFKV